MVKRDEPWADGTPCWVDLGVDDVGAARLFYEGLFGWQIEEGPPESGGYLMCLSHGRPAAGLGPKMAAEQPTFWTTYLASSDADETCAKVVANGGQVVVAPMDVMTLGRMAIAMDSVGGVFGIWQAGSMPGVGVANEPGSLTWSEHLSRDFEASKAFYAAVFGYQYKDMSGNGSKYATVQVNGAEVGGIGEHGADVQADVPANWGTYFAVEDTDQAVDALVKLGGEVFEPAADMPYGRMATVADGAGARFSLISVPPEGYDAAGADGHQ